MFTKLSSPVTFPVYIDNKALYNSIHCHHHLIDYSPSEALASEQDLLLQIKSLLNLTPLNITIHHIDVPIAENNLATAAHSETSPSSISYVLPMSGCSINLHCSTITHQIPYLLYQAAHESYLCNRILALCSWTHTTHIDWPYFQ